MAIFYSLESTISTRRPGEVAAAQKVEMEMRDRLPRRSSVIDHHAEAGLIDPLQRGQLRYHLVTFTNDQRVLYFGK